MSLALSSSPVFSPSKSSSSAVCSPNSSSSPRLVRLNKTSGLIRALAGVGDTSAAVMKRKRPPRLDIPVISMVSPVEEMVSAVEKEEKEEEEGYAVCCKKGRRDQMEDRFSAVVGLRGDSKQAFFGVFDGHGGSKAAEYAAENLDKNIMDELERRDDGEIEQAVRSGYLNTDSEFLRQDLRGGTCCVTGMIMKGDLVVSNAGDCRAVLSRGGVAEALTSDHRPSREDEKDRIETLGGFVECRNGVWRVLGSLAVSRGIGDGYLKQWITAEPDTKIIRLKPEYEFLLLASDGLWDKVSNQEAVDIARPLCVGVEQPQPLSACRKLVDLSVSRGSHDDISVMLIQLGRFC